MRTGMMLDERAGLPPVTDEVFSCHLVGPFSIAVQVLVGTLGFSTLIVKRHFERPRRPWRVWGFDVSKQVISGTVMHMCNLLVSALSGGGRSSEKAGGDGGSVATNPCSWYVLNLTLDCTLGVLFIVCYLRLFELLAARLKIRVLRSGDYGVPPSWREWAKQGLMFLSSMLGMKMTVVLLLVLAPSLVALGDLILKPVLSTHNPRFEIVFVMAIWPLVLNICESWILDQVIKKKDNSQAALSASGHMPLGTDDPAALADSYALHESSLSIGGRTLDAGSAPWETRLSLDVSEFDADSASDSDGKSAYSASGRQSADSLNGKDRGTSGAHAPSGRQ